MSNSGENARKSKGKSKSEPFLWTDDEVELLLNVTLEYKVGRATENVNWESCQMKYSDILDLFVAHYPFPENAALIG